MELKFDKCKYNIDSEGFWLSLRVTEKEQAKFFLDNWKDKLHIAILKVFRNKRSLDANAYLWVLLQKMAEVLKSTKDELYLQELAKYGQFTHIVVHPSIADKVKNEWRVSEEVGDVTINGNTGRQIRCYFGSSTYNTKEMSVLIDGVVSDCKELGIETLPPEKLESMKASWGK